MEKTTLQELVNQGLDNTQIANFLNCHRITVGKNIKFLGVIKPPRQMIVKCFLCGNEINKKTNNRRRCNSCNTRIRRYRTKLAAVQYKGGKCQRCGYKKNISALEFHHLFDDKEFEIGNVANRSWKFIVKELDKCELLCSNCHKIEHTGIRDEKFLFEVENYKGKIFDMER